MALCCFPNFTATEEDTDEIVGLNIGGVHYLTTRSTLLGKNLATQTKNFFHGLLSGKFKTLKDSKNNFFIDRNGRYGKIGLCAPCNVTLM
jgi:orotate phosphoribosyltransferase-like protein